MGFLKKFWGGLSVRVRVLGVCALLLVLGVTVAGVVQLMRPDSGVGGSNAAVKEGEDTAASSEAEDFGRNAGRVDLSEPDFSDLGVKLKDFKIKVDKDGYGVMPVTKDPVEAAAGAAAVMFTVDGEKHKDREKWVSEIAKRISWPSPDYVGGVGSALNWNKQESSNKVNESIDPQLVFKEQDEIFYAQFPDYDDPTGYNAWVFAMPYLFDMLGWTGSKITAVPVEVINEDELRIMDESQLVFIRKGLDTKPTKEGATVANYWVRVKLVQERGKGAVDLEDTVPIGLQVYCDPPGEGGLCGIMSHIPKVWPKQFNSKTYAQH